MKNPSVQKKRVQNRRPFYTKKWTVFGILIGLVILVGLGWAIVTKVQNDHTIQKQKQQFAQAEKDIDKVTAAITAQIGKPADQKTNKSCGYSNQEFSKGFLSCNIDSDIVYVVSDETSAKDLAGKLRQARKAQPEREEEKSSNYFVNRSNNISLPDHFLDESYKDKTSNLDCQVGYFFFFADYPPSGFPAFKVQSNSQNLLLEINCSAYTKAALYPIQQ